jgi:hypothetical protein
LIQSNSLRQAVIDGTAQTYHYNIDQGLLWLLERFQDGRLVPRDAAHLPSLLALRTKVSAMPIAADAHLISVAGLQLLARYGSSLNQVEYAAIYHVLAEARDSTAPTA